MPTRSSKPRMPDPAEFALGVIRQITGESISEQEQPPKNPAAVALGKLGGAKGGAARAAALTSAERSLIASKAAKARWNRKNGK